MMCARFVLTIRLGPGRSCRAPQPTKAGPRGAAPEVSEPGKDTVMRTPPKRNMKTKSAVRPRKEPSSSMRQ